MSVARERARSGGGAGERLAMLAPRPPPPLTDEWMQSPGWQEVVMKRSLFPETAVPPRAQPESGGGGGGRQLSHCGRRPGGDTALRAGDGGREREELLANWHRIRERLINLVRRARLCLWAPLLLLPPPLLGLVLPCPGCAQRGPAAEKICRGETEGSGWMRRDTRPVLPQHAMTECPVPEH